MISYSDFCKLLDNRGYFYEHENVINEALTTYPIDSIINGIMHSTLMKSCNISVTKDVYRNIAYARCKAEHVDIQVLDILSAIASRRGYFISHVEYMSNKDGLVILKDFLNKDSLELAKKNAESFNIVFESKYNTEFRIGQKYIYHCTTESVLHKILKDGLIPRSRSKITLHPERIYFALDKKSCQDLILQFIKDSEKYAKEDSQFIKDYKNTKRKFVILKIDTEKLNVKFMEDPNCKDYWGVFGIYTADNIPTSLISIEH